LPLVLVPARAGGQQPLVLLLSGDGDWAAFVRGLAERLADRGAPVLGVKMRSYLSTPRTPGEAAAALAPAVERQLQESGRRTLAIVGYSRGADLAPFLVNRWPMQLRDRIVSIVLIGLSERASLQFHFEDLFRDVARPTDLPTRPELEKIADIPIVCVRGEDEPESLCAHPLSTMRTIVRPGPHQARVDDGTIEIVLSELGLIP
jgi:type IV secretory pathway VirJ component